jgi:hypothetical protein
VSDPKSVPLVPNPWSCKAFANLAPEERGLGSSCTKMCGFTQRRRCLPWKRYGQEASMFRTRVQQRANQVWLHNVMKVKNISKNTVMNMKKD